MDGLNTMNATNATARVSGVAMMEIVQTRHIHCSASEGKTLDHATWWIVPQIIAPASAIHLVPDHNVGTLSLPFKMTSLS